MLNLCYISIYYPPEPYGAARHAYELSKNIADLGHKVFVLCPSFKCAEVKLNGNMHVHHVFTPMKTSGLFELWFGLFSALKLLHLRKKYYIQAFVVHAGSEAAIVATLNRGVFFAYRPTGSWHHHFWTTQKYVQFVKKIMYQVAMKFEEIAWKKADIIVPPCKAVAREITRYGASQRKIRIIYTGINPALFAPAINRAKVRSELGLGENEKILLFAGTLTPRKGLHYLIRAMPMILRRYPNTKLLIVGDAPQYERGYKKSILQLVNQLGIKDNISFKGEVLTSKMPYLYQAADLFVLPSIYEPFSNALLEAMSCGKAVVATNVGGNPEIVGDAGILVKPSSPEAIAQAVVEKLGEDINCCDARKRIVNLFGWDRTASNLVETIKAVHSKGDRNKSTTFDVLKVWNKVHKEDMKAVCEKEKRIFRLATSFTRAGHLFFLEKKRSILLDIGCGRGWLFQDYKEKDYEVIGIDLSEIALKYLQERKGFADVHLIKAEASKLPVRKNSISVAVSWGLLEHFPRPREVLKEWSRILKKEGNLLVSVPNQFHPSAIKSTICQRMGTWRYGYEKRMTPNYLLKLLQSVGLRNVRSRTYNFFPIITFRAFPALFLRLLSSLADGIENSFSCLPLLRELGFYVCAKGEKK